MNGAEGRAEPVAGRLARRRLWLLVLPLLLWLGQTIGSVQGRGLENPAAGTAAPGSAALREPPAARAGTLTVGTYLRSIDQLDLSNNSFEAGFDLWTLWSGPPERDPGAGLRVLNDIHNGDTYQFEQRASRRVGGITWTLYSVHSRFIHRWHLASYPFDRHTLHMRVGLADPSRNDVVLAADQANSGMSPDLYLYGWKIGDGSIGLTTLSTMSTLGSPTSAAGTTIGIPAVSTSLELTRRAQLHLLPDFLGYILAVGLCVLALLISRTRDDLILAAVVSAAGNYVFLAGILPVGAMAGFIGQLQLVILAGILYVVGADEILDHHLGRVAPRWADFLRSAVLPSYLLLTMVAIYLIIPGGVVDQP